MHTSYYDPFFLVRRRVGASRPAAPALSSRPSADDAFERFWKAVAESVTRDIAAAPVRTALRRRLARFEAECAQGAHRSRTTAGGPARRRPSMFQLWRQIAELSH